MGEVEERGCYKEDIKWWIGSREAVMYLYGNPRDRGEAKGGFKNVP